MLRPEAGRFLVELAAFALELGQLQDLPELGGEQAFLLAFEASDSVPEVGLPSLHLLG